MTKVPKRYCNNLILNLNSIHGCYSIHPLIDTLKRSRKLDKTRQAKTWQDMARHGKTRQDKINMFMFVLKIFLYIVWCFPSLSTCFSIFGKMSKTKTVEGDSWSIVVV